MNSAQDTQWTEQISGDIFFDEPMVAHCTWKAGGAAKVYVRPQNLRDIQTVLAHYRKARILWVGLGSNILIRDGGFDGVIINTTGRLKSIEIKRQAQGWRVSSETGTSCARYARELATQGIGGAEFFSGIPGTMGGALAMNAGAFGGQCWDYVHAVETIDKTGKVQERVASAFTPAYRQVTGLRQDEDYADEHLPAEWFVRGIFYYPDALKRETQHMRAQIKNLLAQRNKTQPVNLPNAGSVFKNPPGDYAARLIQEAGLKGFGIGKAMVSPKHANFIINTGGASADDIERLIRTVQRKVQQRFDILLETEVKIYGQHAI